MVGAGPGFAASSAGVSVEESDRAGAINITAANVFCSVLSA